METAHCDIRGLSFSTTPEAYLKLVQICDSLALKANYTIHLAIWVKLAVDDAMHAKYFSRKPILMVAWANHLSDLSICNCFRYFDHWSLSIDSNENLQRLIMCFIDFAELRGTFRYQQLREFLEIVTSPVDLPKREPKAPPNAEHANPAGEKSAAAAEVLLAQVPAPQPRLSSIQSSDPIYVYLSLTLGPRARSPLCLPPPSEVSESASST